MNADKIILPDFLIADLFKSSLVDINTSNEQKSVAIDNLSTEATVTAPLPGKIKYFGDNLKNVTIVVNQPSSPYLNKEDLTFLTNILKACQLNITDIAIVNTAEQQVNFMAIKEQLAALQIVLFDVEPSLIKLPFMIPPFQVQNYAGSTIMLAPALSALNKPDNEGRLLKTKLWNSLKRVFNIDQA